MQAEQISCGGGSAVQSTPLWGLGADWAEMANERELSQTLGSPSPRIVASGWSV